MVLEPAPALAFVQLDGGTFACEEGTLERSDQPPPGRAAFLAPDFSLDPARGWWWSAHSAGACRVHLDEWRQRYPAAANARGPLAWQPPEEARFRAAFDSLRARLDGGRLRKGVPFTRRRAALPPGEAWPFFRGLLARVPDLPDGLMAYGLYTPASGDSGPEFVIGATPELLFDAGDGGRLRMLAVAGTRSAQPGAEAALVGSAKDRVEHKAVVDDLVAQAGRWGVPRVGATRVRRFGSLLHLVTEVDLALGETPAFDDLVRALHPTPALGVSPRGAEGAAWLQAIDPGGARRRFGAPFGVRWPSGEGRAVVAIRALQYSEGHVEIWAGCGVVAASEYCAEWGEVLDKMDAVRTLWGV